MSERRLGSRRFLLITRRRWVVIGAVAMLGLLAGAGSAVLSPQTLTSTALVGLSSSAQHSAGGQARVQVRVLPGELRPGSIRVHLNPAPRRDAVQVNRRTPSVVSITAPGTTAVQAQHTANAAASSYVAYVNSPSGFGGPVQARILQPAVKAAGTPLSHRLLVSGGLGALLGALIGAVGAISLGRRGRLFRMK